MRKEAQTAPDGGAATELQVGGGHKETHAGAEAAQRLDVAPEAFGVAADRNVRAPELLRSLRARSKIVDQGGGAATELLAGSLLPCFFPRGTVMRIRFDMSCRDIVMVDSATWTTRLDECRKVRIFNLRQLGWRQNCDGIDLITGVTFDNLVLCGKPIRTALYA